ncbi:alpha/beta fold hydrolase [Streptomyces sp. NBC_01497]|uniref:alpha/beta fold hydrolase n=1 Tax=Streptomyces sp. NBC_01497 TaxID=2903885 RepID=UPI002E2F6CD6|nr:alpha/beta fold hydrolase [Streptomyces sp. NBC_01497]
MASSPTDTRAHPALPPVRTVRVNGLRLAYRTWGEEHGTAPVVLVHGRTADSGDWAGIARALAGRRRVVALDQRGHGRSDRPGTYTLPAFRDDLGGFLTALGLTGADVVAHSMGGFAASLLAQEAPDLVARLVLEESPPLLPFDPPRPPAVRPPGELGFDWALVPAVDAALNAPDPAWFEGLVRIRARTLVVAGGPDSPFPQQWFVRQAARVPGAELVTIRAGHLVHTTRPREFLAALADFGI